MIYRAYDIISSSLLYLGLKVRAVLQPQGQPIYSNSIYLLNASHLDTCQGCACCDGYRFLWWFCCQVLRDGLSMTVWLWWVCRTASTDLQQQSVRHLHDVVYFATSLHTAAVTLSCDLVCSATVSAFDDLVSVCWKVLGWGWRGQHDPGAVRHLCEGMGNREIYYIMLPDR